VSNAVRRGISNTGGDGKPVRTVDVIRFVRIAENQVKFQTINGCGFPELAQKSVRTVGQSGKPIALHPLPAYAKKDALYAERSMRSNMSSSGMAAGEPVRSADIKHTNGIK
jgi:hypothetical protein